MRRSAGSARGPAFSCSWIARAAAAAPLTKSKTAAIYAAADRLVKLPTPT
jgi:hypothetical protein